MAVAARRGARTAPSAGSAAGGRAVTRPEAAHCGNCTQGGAGTCPGNPLPMPDRQHDGVPMDDNGVLYLVSETGGGDIDLPRLWV